MANWADIVTVMAPQSALAGELVNIVVRVKNIGGYGFYAAVSGIYDTTEFYFSPDYQGIAPGETLYFSGSFTMPSKKVRVTVYSFFWTGSEWYKDDEDYIDINLAGLVSAFSEFAISDYRVIGR